MHSLGEQAHARGQEGDSPLELPPCCSGESGRAHGELPPKRRRWNLAGAVSQLGSRGASNTHEGGS